LFRLNRLLARSFRHLIFNVILNEVKDDNEKETLEGSGHPPNKLERMASCPPDTMDNGRTPSPFIAL